MIPRMKPYLGREELRAALRPRRSAVPEFEAAFAAKFGLAHAVSFGYGRSALRTLLEVLEIRGSEVVMPAYTCSVVAHAVMLSGNVPRFVDITAGDYNMDLGEVEAAIGAETRMVVATHLFGYALDVDRLRTIVEAKQRRYGRKIWVVQDCAHSFGARWQGRDVGREPDVSLYGLNASKVITSIFGGVLALDDADLARRLSAARDRTPAPASPRWRRLRRRAYLAALFVAFDERVYRAVRWLDDNTPLLARQTRAYHRDDTIHFPPDAAFPLGDVEASVGLEQLRKYDDVIARRRANAAYYDTALRGALGDRLPPLSDGATYSHYTLRVDARQAAVAAAARRGVELGTVIDYSIPELSSYAELARGRSYPNASLAARTATNLPVHPGLTAEERAHVAAVGREVLTGT
jgi:perosamine synthetase